MPIEAKEGCCEEAALGLPIYRANKGQNRMSESRQNRGEKS
jgi:hypothetical protein